MNVVVLRRYGRKIFVVNGQPCMAREAAKQLGLRPKTLEKRVERGAWGADLSKPAQPRKPAQSRMPGTP